VNFKVAMVLSAVALAGCASVPLAEPDKDKAAKTFAVRPGFSNIYVYRNQSFGAAVAMTVAVDGVVVGKTAADTYLVVEVRPGPHTIQSRAEDESSLRITAAPGQSYFVHQEVTMGRFRARSVLHAVDAAEAKAVLDECNLAESI
jgi:uncharacterized protein DUF2846